jgi:hypothetical protein
MRASEPQRREERGTGGKTEAPTRGRDHNHMRARTRTHTHVDDGVRERLRDWDTVRDTVRLPKGMGTGKGAVHQGGCRAASWVP